MIGFALALLLGAAPQEPATAPPEQVLEYASVISERVGEEIHYEFLEVRWTSASRSLRADRVSLRLAREPYEAVASGSRILGDLSSELLGQPGQPVENALVLELRLQGNVELTQADGVLRCSWAAHQPPLGLATFHEVELTMRGDLGPRGWPWRLRAEILQEFADGSVRAKRAQLTACDLDDPAYALAMLQLDGVRDEEGNFIWSPSAPWLEIGHRRVLPMPAFDFRTGEEESGFGLRSMRISSGRQLGTALELGFAASTNWSQGSLDWRLYPGFSTRRGLPLRTTFSFDSEALQSDWDLFFLDDAAADVHGLRTRVARSNDTRWRLRLDNRLTFSELWRLDADLALTSDAIVDPEFFREDWVAEDDALSELYLRRQDGDSHLSLRTTARLDEPGFTPLRAYGPIGSAETQQLDLLPRLQYRSFPRAVTALPTGAAGGRDRRSPLDWSWGFDVGRLRMRSVEVEAPAGRPDYLSLADETRDRALLWGELDTQLLAGPVVLRPGVRLEAGAVHDAAGTGGDTQSSAEAFVEASLALERRYENGWVHRVRPMLRLRDRQVFNLPDSHWYPFEDADRRRPGQALEMSLRQLWYGPRAHAPWLDLNFLVPYYLDSEEQLADTAFPALRAAQDASPWGPAELRAVWDPGVRRGMLRGVRASSNLRYGFEDDHLEEWFARLSLAPQQNWRVSLTQRLLDQLEDPSAAFRSTSFDASWRINETFELRGGQTFSARGNSTTLTRYGLIYYGHGFAFEFYSSRNDLTGESRYGVNLMPCFLVERYQAEPGAPPRDLGLEY